MMSNLVEVTQNRENKVSFKNDENVLDIDFANDIDDFSSSLRAIRKRLYQSFEVEIMAVVRLAIDNLRLKASDRKTSVRDLVKIIDTLSKFK